MSLGRNNAMKLGEDAGAWVKIGRRVLYDCRKIDDYLDSLRGGVIILKNKHNRVNADQSGNSGFAIRDLLTTVKKNAISSQVLVALVGSGSVRELQHLIAAERKAGAVICSSTKGGYFLPANQRETAEFCKTLENRAKNTFIAI